MYAFVNLKIIIWWQESDSVVDLGVVKDIVGDRVQGTSGTAGLSD